MKKADLFIGTVVFAGFAAVAHAIVRSDAVTIDVTMVALLVALAAVAQRAPVMLFRSSAVSVSFSAVIAAYVLFGTGAAILVALTQAAMNAFTPKRKPLRKILFNTGNLTFSAFLASETYVVVGGQIPPSDVIATLLAVLVSGAVYYLVDSVNTALVIALTTRARFVAVWRENYSWMAVNFLATAMSGASLALAYQALSVFGFLAFSLPLFAAWWSFQLYMSKSTEVRERNAELERTNTLLQLTNDRLEESHLSVVGALVGALEAKDRYTHGHSAATMFHALAVGRKLGLDDEELGAIELGALFHDIGKIGIPEQILRKPGGLTTDEWEEMRTHPIIGAKLLARVPALERVGPIVLAHHERYDGTGYPHGLKGNEIPLAAQVIAVADAFEAMTSTRPYRRALPREVALAELERAAGTQFDPRVVQLFVEMLRNAPEETHDHEGAEHTHVYKHAAAAVRVAG